MTDFIAYIPLESLEVATPCRANWNKMQGDERTRYCGSCAKNVYNLSGMTRAEAEALVRSREGEICIRLMRRADGTVLTSDCPVGMQPARRAVKWTATTALILLAPLLPVGTTLLAASPATKQFCACGSRLRDI
jgi:hypothetical protein